MSNGIAGVSALPGPGVEKGMNMLEAFTLAAMHAMLSSGNGTVTPEFLATQAVKFAEATLAELATANAG